MRNGFFAKLAVVNIKKNRSTYIPYMLACIGCVAMFYMLLFINGNRGIDTIPHSGDVRMITALGTAVVGIFSFIFLLYSNSFLMKRRQKELGLYNILGMEKGHIGKMMFLETIFSSAVSLAAGILLGILGSKLALLLLLKLVRVPAQFGFEISTDAIVCCVVVYGAVFLLILLNNLRKVHFTQPIELLRGGNVGEKEPKANWFMALLGFICLGSGYYIAITTESPLSAIPLFFLAVLLVMAGTYLLFTAGSIAILKMLRRKKSFYYKTRNFTSVSGMIYRMKQNAVGLASICILSTGVLLMISSTVCLHSGVGDIMKGRYPKDVNISFRGIDRNESEWIQKEMQKQMEEQAIHYENAEAVLSVSIACIYRDDGMFFEQPGKMLESGLGYLTLLPEKEYEEISGEDVELLAGEILVYQKGSKDGPEMLKLNGNTYQVKEWLEDLNFVPEMSIVTPDRNHVWVVCDEDFERIDQEQREVYGDYLSPLKLEYNFDIKGTKEEKVAYGHQAVDISEKILESGNVSEDIYRNTGIREEEYESFYGFCGGLLFLGLFLGGLFLMGTAMIIYYKQISEGYEDKNRFEIMQKVGMSRKEVKSSIHRQIVMVFFIPLLMAGLHIAMAFPMVKRLLSLFGMSNTTLFAICTAVTLGVFAVIYGIIYALTARAYYRIVERAR